MFILSENDFKMKTNGFCPIMRKKECMFVSSFVSRRVCFLIKNVQWNRKNQKWFRLLFLFLSKTNISLKIEMVSFVYLLLYIHNVLILVSIFVYKATKQLIPVVSRSVWLCCFCLSEKRTKFAWFDCVITNVMCETNEIQPPEEHSHHIFQTV